MYRWVEHTSEVELEIVASSEREVLLDALAALAELVGTDAREPPGAGEPAEREVRVSAADRPALLAGWLEELAYLAESEGFVATAVRDLQLRAGELRAAVTGILGDPPPLVKAVTYHRLLFEPSGRGYVGRVVLDV
jgi:SHS2 domain-containing protein